MSKALLYPNWRDKVVFSSEGPRPQVLLQNEKVKVVVAGLEAGQKIPPHPEVQGVYHFLDGTGWMSVDEERFRISAGATVCVEPGAVRGIEAETRLVFLAVRVA